MTRIFMLYRCISDKIEEARKYNEKIEPHTVITIAEKSERLFSEELEKHFPLGYTSHTFTTDVVDLYLRRMTDGRYGNKK